MRSSRRTIHDPRSTSSKNFFRVGGASARARNATRRGLSGGGKPRVELLRAAANDVLFFGRRLTQPLALSWLTDVPWLSHGARASPLFLVPATLDRRRRRHRVTRLNGVDASSLQRTRVGPASRPSIGRDPIGPARPPISPDWSLVPRSIVRYRVPFSSHGECCPLAILSSAGWCCACTWIELDLRQPTHSCFDLCLSTSLEWPWMNFLSQIATFSPFQGYLSITQAKRIIYLLHLDIVPTNYCVRFGHSLAASARG